MLAVIGIQTYVLTRTRAGSVGAWIVLGGVLVLPALYLMIARVEVREGSLLVRTAMHWSRIPLAEVTGVALFRLGSTRASEPVALIHGKSRGLCMLSRVFWSDSTIVRLRDVLHTPGSTLDRLPAGKVIGPRALEKQYEGSISAWRRHPTVSAFMFVVGLIVIVTPLALALGSRS
jgi:hypothetical protein